MRVVRISRKSTIYLPKEIAKRLGVTEGDFLELRVEGGVLIATPILHPFKLALEGPKYAKTTIEEFEKESEEEQRRYESTGHLFYSPY